MKSIISELTFIGQRFGENSFVDILLVACVLFLFIKLIQGTRAGTLLRGLIILFVVFGVISLISDLTAFNWLVSKALPVFLIMIPVIFAPEVRRIFERLGGLETIRDLFSPTPRNAEDMYNVAGIISDACARLAAKNHGALIIMEKLDHLDKLNAAGIRIDAKPSVELLLQIFYPNTPLHDGAVLIRDGRIYAASCVMPLSSRNALEKNPERHMGLRHRAALGVSEEMDCLAIVVSEETGSISLCRNGSIQRNLTQESLCSLIQDNYQKPEPLTFKESAKQIISGWSHRGESKDR